MSRAIQRVESHDHSGSALPTPLTWEHLAAAIALQTYQSSDLTKILRGAVEATQQLLGCDRVLIYQLAPGSGGRVLVEAFSEPCWSLRDRIVQDSWFEVDWLETYQEGQMRAIADVATANLPPGYADVLAGLSVKASLVVPVLCQSRLWGLLIVHSCTGPCHWPTADLEGLQQIAVQLGIAIRQAELGGQLQAAQANLEAQVAARTRDLEQTNQQLAAKLEECQQMMATLAQSNDGRFQLAAIVNSSDEAIVSKTPDGIITSWNRAAEQLWGYTAAEIIGQPVMRLIPPDRQSEEAAILQCIRRGVRVETFETQRLHKDGSLIDVALTISPIHDAAGRVIGASKIARDIRKQQAARRDRDRLETERNQALLELRQSQTTSQAILLAIPDLLLRVKRDGTCCDFLPPTGSQAEVFLPIQQHLAEILPPDLLQKQLEAIEQALTTQNLQVWEQKLLKNEKFRYEEVRVVPCGDDECLVIIRDISDRKQSELDFKWAKDQLELVLQASSEGFCDWDLVTGDIYFSPQWKAILGYADHELENSQEMWKSLILEDDLAKALQLIDNYISDRIEDFTTTLRFRHKDGFIVHMLARAIHLKDDQGNVVRLVSSYLDTTQTVEIQNALKTSEMQLSSILNSSLDGIMAFRSVRDSQGTIVDFEWLLSNPMSCQIIGKEVDHIVGKRLLEELPGNRADGLFERYVTVVESGEPMQHEFYYNHDGIDCWFENVAVKLGDGFAVTFRDITDIKQSEITLQQTNIQLEDRISELDQRHSEMLVLSEVSDFLQACSTVEEACHTIVNLIEPLFPHCSGAIFTTSASLNRLEQVVAWGSRLHSCSEFEPHSCWGLRRGRMHWVRQDRLSLRCKHVLAQAMPDQEQAATVADTLCMPMIAHGETLGLFHLSTEIPEALPEAKQQLARTLAEQVGMAIANLKLQETLKHQSIRDPLTGLYNRRYLEESLSQEIVRSQRKQLSIGVIMIDIDHFKRFNDTFGHDVGDAVLKLVGTLLKDSVRHSDIACRYGGEEMTLILLEATLVETTTRAETIRAAISQLRVSHQGQLIDSLTASFGVACFPHHGSTGSALIKAADAALYRAKQAGRNQVIAAL